MTDIKRLQLLPRSAEAVGAINRSGFLAILATNQSGVARGLFPARSVHLAHARLRSLLARKGAFLDSVYFCPHHPREGRPPFRMHCQCRKPHPGMLLRAAREHRLDLKECYMVGDSVKDMEMAWRAGATPVMVLTGYGRGERERLAESRNSRPAQIAGDLMEAITWILSRHGNPER